MSLEIKCKVHEIHPTVEVNDKFKKRELIVEYAENPSYPEYVKFEAQQDKVNLLDNLKVGDEIEVFFNLRGRPWTNKEGVTSYFNNNILWRVNVLGASENLQPVSIEDDGNESLPF